jgi:hypothetical protein
LLELVLPFDASWALQLHSAVPPRLCSCPRAALHPVALPVACTIHPSTRASGSHASNTPTVKPALQHPTCVDSQVAKALPNVFDRIVNLCFIALNALGVNIKHLHLIDDKCRAYLVLLSPIFIAERQPQVISDLLVGLQHNLASRQHNHNHKL